MTVNPTDDEKAADRPADDPIAVAALESSRAETRRSKRGVILLVDFREEQTPSRDLIEALQGLPKLRELNFADCAVGDSIADTLAKLDRLQILDLQRTQVTDHLVDTLVRMPALKLVDLSETAVSLDRVRAARKAMIGTRIVFL